MRKKNESFVKREEWICEQEIWKIIEFEAEIRKLPYEAQIEAWRRMNTCLDQWPEDLIPKPDGWESKAPDAKKHWIRRIQQCIEFEVGEKAVLRHAKRVDNGWNDRQFEDWWDSFRRR